MPTDQPVNWALIDTPRVTTIVDAKGRTLRGIEVTIAADAPALRVQQGLLTSVRVLRDYEARGRIPDEISVVPTQQGDAITWSRD
jgi:hypothetical protein